MTTSVKLAFGMMKFLCSVNNSHDNVSVYEVFMQNETIV